jgi:hypothetical protein
MELPGETIGSFSFFKSLETWPEMDYLVQCDVVKCVVRIGDLNSPPFVIASNRQEAI